VKNPVAVCGISFKGKTIMGAATPRSPFAIPPPKKLGGGPGSFPWREYLNGHQ